MIDISQLTKKDIGRYVIYNDGLKEEKGKIKSWNDHYIFVVFHCNSEWDKFKNYTGCACKQEDLVFY